MTIESTRAPEGVKPTASGTPRAAAKPGQTGLADANAGQGFAGLMSLLSATDTAGEASDVGVSGTDSLLSSSGMAKDDDKNSALALGNEGLVAINAIAFFVPPAQASGNASPIQTTDKRLASDKVDTSLVTLPGAEAPEKGHGRASGVATLLNNRSANVSSGISQVQAELREVRPHQFALTEVVTPDVSRMAQAMASVNGASNSPERTPGKLHSGTPGAGMEGLLGTALADKLGMSPTYEVAPTTAVVPDTQVAETVSYWATHGVQNAELTLDGLGHEPVEVRISVDGDQTQVDFRSNQPEVRQALESASAQLKTMLSSEGLQLTGMSIGTSGKGQTPGDGGQPKPSPRQTTRVSLAPTVATTAHVANLSVGQALDLYV